MRNMLVPAVFMMSLCAASLSQAMDLKDLKSCLDEDINRLQTSKNFKDFVSNTQMTATEILINLSSDSFINSSENYEGEDLALVKNYISKSETLVKASKTCAEVHAKATVAFSFENEFQKRIQEIQQSYKQSQKTIQTQLQEAGLKTAAATISENNLFILSILQSEMAFYSSGNNPAEFLKGIIMDSFTELVSALEMINEEYDDQVASLEVDKDNQIKDQKKLAELTERADQLALKIEKEMDQRAATFTAHEIESLLLIEGIQKKTLGWREGR